MQKGGKMKRIGSIKVFILMLLLTGLIPMSVNAASMKENISPDNSNSSNIEI